MNRKKSREVAMMLLYEMSINKNNYEDVIKSFECNISLQKSTNIDLNHLDTCYIKNVLKGIESKKDTIDSEIEKHLINWELERLSKVDLAILRICTYEILFEEDIPFEVSINEGIELAKKYSSEDAGSFINGVLDSIKK